MVEEHGGKLTLTDSVSEGVETGTCVELTLGGVVDGKTSDARHNNRQQEAVA